MSSGTFLFLFLFLLLLVVAPLAMMLMHRGGHGGTGGGCGMGHGGSSHADHTQAGHQPVSAIPDNTESGDAEGRANPSGTAHEPSGQEHQRHHC